MTTLSQNAFQGLLTQFISSPETFPARLHGNGFLQIDLDATRRLHVWDPRLPRQKVPTPIHNHRFDFSSTVLLGAIEHWIYEVHAALNGDYQIFEPKVRDGEDTILELAHYGRYDVKPLGAQRLPEGATYTFPAGVYHQTNDVELAVTVMEKTRVHELTPRVLVPFGETPDNFFNRYDWDDHETVKLVLHKAIDGLHTNVGYSHG